MKVLGFMAPYSGKTDIHMTAYTLSGTISDPIVYYNEYLLVNTRAENPPINIG
jgi:hypothetical protein